MQYVLLSALAVFGVFYLFLQLGLLFYYRTLRETVLILPGTEDGKQLGEFMRKQIFLREIVFVDLPEKPKKTSDCLEADML